MRARSSPIRRCFHSRIRMRAERLDRARPPTIPPPPREPAGRGGVGGTVVVKKVYGLSLRCTLTWRLSAGAAVKRDGLPPLLDAPTAASDEATRRPSVVRQPDVDHGLPSVILRKMISIALSFSPVCGCGALPQPRSSNA